MFDPPGQFIFTKISRPQAPHLKYVAPVFENHDFETEI